MSTNMSDTFANALQRARKTAGLTQRAIAEQIGVAPGYVSQLELGARRPNDFLRIQLVNLLQIDPDLPDAPHVNVDWGFGSVTLLPRVQIEWMDPTGEMVLAHLERKD